MNLEEELDSIIKEGKLKKQLSFLKFFKSWKEYIFVYSATGSFLLITICSSLNNKKSIKIPQK